MLSSQDHNQKMAASLLAWWRDAGVDYVTEDQPMNWLSPKMAAPVVGRFVESPVVEKQPLAPPTVLPKQTALAWPEDLLALKALVQQKADLPGLSYGGNCAVPVGETGATAMAIGDFPDDEEILAGQFGAGGTAKLLTNMLLAAQIVPDLSYLTALALSRPAAGSLPKNDLAPLADFARHQIKLVQPKVVVIFGAAACEALLAEELMSARGQLRFINHDDRKTAAVATFHPRTLMAQPQLKAQAWKDLQMLIRKDYQ
jgi:uracil-DNA glycosylase